MSPSIIMKARGLGIIAVVYGHVNPNLGLEVGTFHMPLFFFLGGLTLSPDRSIARVARFVLVDLLLFAVAATFFYTIVALALEPLGLRFRTFSDWSPARFTVDILRHVGHHVEFALTAWFLLAYAGAVVLSELATRLVPERAQFIVLSLLIAALFYIGIDRIAPLYDRTAATWFWNYAAQVMVGTAFMLAGYLTARGSWLATAASSAAWMFATFVVYVYFANLLQPPTLGMVFSEYPRGWFWSAFFAILGILLTLQLSTMLDRVSGFAFLDAIGRASKHIMIHHLFVFTLVNLGFAALGWMSLAEITSVYTKLLLPLTWPVYLIGGTALPWLGYELYLRLKARRHERPARAPAA